MIIDHLGIKVSNYIESRDFYSKVLEPLGYELIMEMMGYAGFGINKKGEFWMSEGDLPISPIHIAFLAKTREQVDKFFNAAIQAGATDNGGPDIRTIYHPDYYGAFVIGPDGHNIEAVCHEAE